MSTNKRMVEFLIGASPYLAGERALFTSSQAHTYVSKGYAKYVSDKPKVLDAEDAVDADEDDVVDTDDVVDDNPPAKTAKASKKSKKARKRVKVSD